MQELVEQSLEFVKASTGNFKASVKILHLPEVKCDPHLIKQVWLNLISNAVKYSGKKENPVIEIGSNPVENGIEYYVKDNGAGFDINLSSNLFHPFQRLHKKSEYEGTGVGLALAHVIVTKHGGEMWADAAVGLGATFFFSLPN
jgi:light-regulated signal transduction histidine kinase (bacteriophytochrome)